MGKLRLLDQARAALRVRLYGLRAGTTYIRWIKPVVGNPAMHEIYPSGTPRKLPRIIAAGR